ncbi:Helix-turn-helix domain-containing protein, partial [Acidaminococcus fermentans]
MPWEERNVTKTMLRREFVERVLAHEKSKTALCLEYGISRPTGDKWIKRYLEDPSCEELSREPHHRANRTSPEMEALVVKTR